jgi:GT2 family glycosyltransferase
MEDVDLGFRLQQGVSLYCRSPWCIMLKNSGTTGAEKTTIFSVYHGHRNLIWTFVKGMPSFLFWLLLPLHVVLNLSIVWFALRSQGQKWSARGKRALLGLPKMWRKRQQIKRCGLRQLGCQDFSISACFSTRTKK